MIGRLASRVWADGLVGRASGTWEASCQRWSVRCSSLEVPAVCAGGTGGVARDGAPSACCVGRQRRRRPFGAGGYDRPMDLPATFDGRPGVTDTLGRAMRDLRISVTDRCNFRCTYCMPKEVFGRDYEFLPRDQVLSFEEIERVARVVRRARRREAPHHRRRAAGPARPARPHRDARRAPPARRRRARPDADDERVGAARAGRAAGGRRAAPGHGQPRLARRRGLRGDERDRLPGRAGARRHRRRDRGRTRAGQGQHGRPPRRQRGEHRADGRAGRARPGSSCASSSTWTSGTRTAGGSTRSCRRPSSIDAIGARWPVEPADPAYRGEVADRWRYLDGARRVRRHLVGHRAVLPRLHAGPAVGRRASSTPACSRSTGRDVRAVLRDGADGRGARGVPRRHLVARATTATRSCARARDDLDLPKVEMFAMGG